MQAEFSCLCEVTNGTTLYRGAVFTQHPSQPLVHPLYQLNRQTCADISALSSSPAPLKKKGVGDRRRESLLWQESFLPFGLEKDAPSAGRLCSAVTAGEHQGVRLLFRDDSHLQECCQIQLFKSLNKQQVNTNLCQINLFPDSPSQQLCLGLL